MERRLITADCHFLPPFSVLDELPESYREHFARIERRDGGVYAVRPMPGSMAGMSAPGIRSDVEIDDDPVAFARMAAGNSCPESQPSFEPAGLLAQLESDGVHGAVLIGRLGGAEPGLPADASIAYCKVVNDWMADAWRPHLDRIAPGIYLPYHVDVAACVAELERAAAMGLRPALLPDAIDERPYYLPEWEPLWEAAEALHVPISMHVGGRLSPNHTTAFPGWSTVSFYYQCLALAETLGWLTFSGVFARHPDLHVVLTEGYADWLSFAIQFFDHHFLDSRFMHGGSSPATAAWSDEANLDAPPSYYIKRQAHVTFMWDPLAIRARDVSGLDCLMWGNDYPHFEGSFPNSNEWIDKQFAGVPDDEVDQIVRGNAARIFGIQV
jgi:predicted TIM-barrel fold metal-dependent hydrolase